MFKKLIISSAIMAVCSGIAFSYPSYKGERIDYKGEACPTCVTYSFLPAPYLGLSVGVRNNYSAAPAVYKGLEGIISLGYGGIVSPSFYLAAELFGGGSINLKNYTNSGVSVKSTWSYGLDIIPGIQLTDPVVGYVRLGVVRTRFNDVGNATGWRAGVGGQTNLWPNWDLRGEYVYTYYNSVGGMNPQSDQFNLGLIYKFC